MTTIVCTCEESGMYGNKGMYSHAKIIIHHTEKTCWCHLFQQSIFKCLHPFSTYCKPVTWSQISVMRPKSLRDHLHSRNWLQIWINTPHPVMHNDRRILNSSSKEFREQPAAVLAVFRCNHESIVYVRRAGEALEDKSKSD